VDRIIERFSAVSIFEGIEHQEIARFLTHAEDLTTEPGEVIIRQGEPGDGLYLISAGSFDVVRETEGRSTVIAQLLEYSFFGEMSLFEDQARSATVLCRSAGRLKRFARDKFHALLDEGDLTTYRVTRNIARVLASRLAAIDDRLVS